MKNRLIVSAALLFGFLLFAVFVPIVPNRNRSALNAQTPQYCPLIGCNINGPITAQKTNTVVNTAFYSNGTTDGGIIEAYAACPSTGCREILGSDITISTATALTITNGKPLWFEQNGHTISMTCTTSPCLKLDATSAQRQQLIWMGGTIDGSGTTAAITGMQILNAQDQQIGPIHFRNFYNTGQTCLDLNNVEDSKVNATFEQCFSSFVAENATNNNDLNLWLNDGGATSGISSALTGIALTLNSSTGNRINGLIQSNKGTITVLLTNSADYNKFDSVWWENNGDGTANSRLVKFDTAPGFIVQTTFVSNFNTGGSLGALGDEFTTTNSAQLFGVNMLGGYHIGYAAWADGTFGSSTPFNLWGEDVVTAGNATNVGVYCSGSVGCTFPASTFNGNVSIGGTNTLTLGGTINTSASILQTGGASGIQIGGGGVTMNGNLSGVGTTWTSNGLPSGTAELFEEVLPVSGPGSGAPYSWYLIDRLNTHTIVTCNQATSPNEVCAFDGKVTTPNLGATTAAIANTATIASSEIPVQTATQTAGQVVCIKSVTGGVASYGTCTALNAATGACTTCN